MAVRKRVELAPRRPSGPIDVWMLTAAPFPGRHPLDGYLHHNDACVRVRDWVLANDALLLQCVEKREEYLPGQYSDQRYPRSRVDPPTEEGKQKPKLKAHDLDLQWSPRLFRKMAEQGRALIFDRPAEPPRKPRGLDGEVQAAQAPAWLYDPYVAKFRHLIIWTNNDPDHAQDIASYLAELGHEIRWFHWDGERAEEVVPQLAVAA